MQKYALIVPVLVIFFSPALSFANSYTLSEVELHDSEADCWMTFEGKVYDFSAEHLKDHEDRFMDILPWCGEDMTEAFKDKAGMDQDHKPFVYRDLENYYIGEIKIEGISDITYTTRSSESETKSNNPYNALVPVAISGGLYLLYWGLTKTELRNKTKLFNKNTFNLTFNTLLLLGLIPSAVFGFIMVMSYRFDAIREIDFDFLYWHVELSIAFATLMFAHFLTRFKLYLAPLKLFRKIRSIA